MRDSEGIFLKGKQHLQIESGHFGPSSGRTRIACPELSAPPHP